MNKQQIAARMDAIVASAEAENRPMTADELVEFDKLKAEHDAAAANEAATAARRAQMPAVRQASGLTERVERLALTPDQPLASLYPRPAGDNRRIGDLIRAQFVGGHDPQAGQTSHTGAQGGFLVPDFISAELHDRARAKSRLFAAGARVVPVSGATSFAVVTGDPEIQGHAELATIPTSQITLASRNYQPQTKATMIEASVELMEDAPNFADVVDQVLSAAFAVELDRAGIYGHGVGEQLGIINSPNIHQIDGGSFTTWRPFAAAYQAVRGANFTPNGFILSPGGLAAIDDLVDSTGQPLARPPSLEGAPLWDTTSIPEEIGSPITTQALTGQFDQCIFALRTPVTIEATRVGGTAMERLSVLIRAYMRVDSFPIRSEAFAVVNNVPVPSL